MCSPSNLNYLFIYSLAHVRTYILQLDIWKQFANVLKRHDIGSNALEALRAFAKYGAIKLCTSYSLVF